MEIWKAILIGCKIFTHWQIYVVVIGYLATIMFGYSYITKSSRDDAKEKKGLIQRFFLSLLNVSATFFSIIILAPIVLGISKHAAWSYPFLLLWHNPTSVAGFFLLLYIVQFLLLTFPFIGRFQSFHLLVIGSFTLIFYLEDMITSGKINVTKSIKSIEYMPSGIESLCFIIICIFFTHLGALISMLTISVFFKNRNTISVPAESLYVLSGFVPVFIYGAWLGNQLTFL